MSLILDALRKLDREKDAREPGVVVVGSVAWGGTRSRWSLVLVPGAVALVALAVGGAWLVRPTPRPTASPAPAEPAAEPAPAPAASPLVPPPAETTESTSAGAVPSLRRPAVPTPAPPDPATDAVHPAPDAGPTPAGLWMPPDDIRLNAISQKDGRPVALINDHLVFEGDSVDGVKVLRIGEAEVEVEVRGERRVLRF